MTNRFYTIQEAANLLGVATKTLRRWDERGLLVPKRTQGNQRRYTQTQIELFKKTKNLPSDVGKSEQFSPANVDRLTTTVWKPTIITQKPEKVTQHFGYAKYLQKGAMLGIFVIALVSGLLFAGLQPTRLQPYFDSLLAAIGPAIGIDSTVQQSTESPAKTNLITQGRVLAEGDSNDLTLRVNIPAAFSQTATVSGELTAPNILYDVLAGSGIAITEGQTPTISSTDTLATVTGRGATTSTALTLSGGATLGNVLNLGQLSSDPSTAVNGAHYYNTTSNKIRCYQNGGWKDCDTDTTNSGDITAVNTGNGLAGGASSGDVSLTLDVSTTSTTSTTSANSGLETDSSGLKLLGGCSNSQVLAWSSSSGVWQCTTTASSGVSGSGTTGTLPKFTAASTIGDSLISESGTTISLSTAATLTASSLATFTTAATLSMGSTTTLNCSDCIDFDDMEDTLDLDASLTLNQTTNTWSQTFTGTTTTGFSYAANSLTTGTTVALSSTATSFGAGNMLTISKTGASGSTAFTGDIQNITYSQTFDGGASITHTGNVLDASRAVTLTAAQTHTISGELLLIADSNTVNNASGTLTWSGDTFAISRNCTRTAGTCTNSGDVVDITQTDTSASGIALYAKNYGTGTSFRVDDVSGDTSPFIIDASGNVGIGSTTAATNLEVAGALRLSTTTTDTFTTPQSSSVATKINIPLFNPGASGQIVITGLPSSAPDTARAFTFVDARTVAHQPTLGVFSVDENDIVGFSWEGTSSTAYIKTLSNVLGLRVGTTDYMSITSATGVTVASGIDLTLTSGTGRYVQTFTGTTTNAATITANSLTSGTALSLTSSGTITSGGELLSLTGNSATTGRIIDLSATGLTTGQAISLGMGTALTTGSGISITGASYAPAASAQGDLVSLAITSTASNTTGNSIVTGVNIASTLNTSGATGTKEINPINIAAPTITACTGGNCTWSGVEVNTLTSGALSTLTSNGLLVTATGISAGTLNATNIGNITAGAGTETAMSIGSGWDTDIAFVDTSPTITIGNTGTLSVTDGTNTLFSIADDTSEGDVTVTGDLAVNGATSADITSSTTTATVLNTTVTTLSIGGAATTFNIGTTDSVTRTINLGTGSGADTINIGTGATTADAITLGNTGVATTIDINSGAATVNALDITTNSITTANALAIAANALTTGTALALSSTATAFNGELLTLSKTGASGSTAFTSDIQNITYSQTFDGGVGLTHSGNVLDMSRAVTLTAAQTHTLSGALLTISDSNTINNASGTLTWSGDTISVTRNCTRTAGTCTDSGNVASLTLSDASATGTVLALSNSGTGMTISVTDDDLIGLGTAAGRIEFDDQATDEVNILNANVGIGTQTPGTTLDVRGNITMLAGSDIRPTTNSTSAINIANAAGTDFVRFNTSGSRVLIGTLVEENSALTVASDSRTDTIETPTFVSSAYTLTTSGDIANQRFNKFMASTLADDGAARTVTTAATVYIEDASATSGAITVTNNYALFVDAGASRFDGPVAFGAQSTLTANSTTPSVSAGSHFITANTVATLISNFTSGHTGQIITIEVNDANTDFDCTASSLNCGTADITVIETGDTIYFIRDATIWNMIGWVDDDASYNAAGGADIAELFVSSETLEAGDLVSIDPTQPIRIHRSKGVYDQKSVGIVSTNPGMILKDGPATENAYPVALVGRVPVKVSTENGSIEIGDYLTSSSIPGVAMKATRPGPVVGKALEAFSCYPEQAQRVEGSLTTDSDTGDSSTPLRSARNDIEGCQGKITTFVNVSFADPQSILANLVIDESGNITTKKSAFADNLVNLTGSSNDWTDTLEGTITNNDGFVKGMDLTILDEWGPTTITIRNEGGKFVMNNAQGTSTIAFDTESGSGYFTGELIAKTLRVENIKGIDLSALIASQSTTLGVQPLKEASASGQSDSEQLLSRLEQLNSKLVSEASSSSQFNLDSVTALTNLTSVGKTFLADTNIAGTLTIGTMTFDDLEDSVNTIGTLKFQDSPLAGAIELFSGSVKLARNGDIETEGVLSAKGVKTQELTITLPQEASSSAAPTNKSIGEGTIKAGNTSVIIETENVKTSSKIFVTATKLLSQPIIVTGKIENKSFTVAIAKPEAQDITFDWWIVNTQRLTLAF